MKIIDRYIITQFLKNFLGALSILILIFVFHTIFTYIDELAGRGLELWIIFKFLIYFIPQLIPIIMPLAVVIASIMTFGAFAESYEFAAMKGVLENYKTQILNMDDLSDNAIKTQEKRVLNVINLSNFLQSFAYFVVLALVLTIIAFAIFFLKTIFSHFIEDIQAKKLLGATSRQIVQPFLNVIFMSLSFAFVLAIVLLVGGLIPLDSYLSALFGIDLFGYLSGLAIDLLAVGVIEIGGIMLLLLCISYRFVMRLHRKLK